MDPTDQQWTIIERLLEETRRPDGRGRPWRDARAVLKRSKRRWVVERFFAWLHNSRRLVTRWERHVENFVAMLQLGCMRILLNRL